MVYINAVKKQRQVWRITSIVLDLEGGPIIHNFQSCHMVAPALGGGFEATLNTQNSLSVGDGFEFSASVNGGNKTDAVNNACNRALGISLFATPGLASSRAVERS